MPEELETTNEETNNESTETTESTETETPEATEEETQTEDDETSEAVTLYKSLTNPNTSRAVLSALAAQMGLSISAGEVTKTEAVRDATAVLTKTLGKEYEFLAPRIGAALNELLQNNTVDNAKLAKLENELREMRQQSAMREINSAMADIYKEHADAGQYEKEMLSLMDEIHPGANTTAKQYLERIYQLASANRQVAEKTKRTIAKINENANDVRRASLEANTSRVKAGSAPPTLREAVRAAIRGQKLE